MVEGEPNRMLAYTQHITKREKRSSRGSERAQKKKQYQVFINLSNVALRIDDETNDKRSALQFFIFRK